MAALQASPLFAAVPAVAANPVKALTVMQATLPTLDGNLPTTAALAATLLASPDVGNELQAAFTAPQLARALEQLRATNVFTSARSLLTGTVNTSGLVPSGSTVSLSSLLDAARKLATNPAAGAAIEQLVAIAEAIAKAPNSATVVGQLKDALTAATTIAANLRQTT